MTSPLPGPDDADERTAELTRQLTTALSRIDNWIDANGWAGWDPYDVWDTAVGRWSTASRSPIRRLGRYALSRAQRRYPVAVRRTLRAQPSVNPKAMGLFAAGFMLRERLANDSPSSHDRTMYEQCFRWLDAAAERSGSGIGWGYPFDWQTRTLIPRRTPTVVNSAIIGDAYWLKYRLHGDDEALRRCEEICQFILTGLNRSPGPDGTFCFSYTPVDRMEVHNANLFGAEFLARLARELCRDDWMDTALAAATFTLRQLRTDGTLNYWSDGQTQGALQQDTYHSGFEIRALAGLGAASGQTPFMDAATHYYRTWVNDYFNADGAPRFARNDPNVIEIHSCAEAILSTALIGGRAGVSDRQTVVEKLAVILRRTNERLWVPTDDDAGFFAWRAERHRSEWRRTAIPLIRWGQAWMFNACATALSVLSETQSTQHSTPSQPQ